MKSVEPIRDKADIKRMRDYLFKKNERDYILFMVGIYTGIRIEDYLWLKVEDVLGDHIYVVERKTKKTNKFAINPKLRKALDAYIKRNELQPYDYLFPSRKKSRVNGVKTVPIQRKAAWQIVSNAGRHVGLEKIGCHSMRKTFGYHFYDKTGDVVKLQKLFNHSTPTITLIYIGYQQDELDEAVLSFDY